MRERFPIFQHHPDLIYLDTAATAHKPREVIEALRRFYEEEYGTVHRAIYRAAMQATEQYNASRETARRFLNAAHPEEIVFTRGTTEALNLIAKGYCKAALHAGDEILISQMEHHSNIVPWQMVAQETGAVLRWIPMDERGVLLWEGTITSRTKIVSVAHVSNVTGTINPIAAIGRAAHAGGAVFAVDGAQGAPHMRVDVQALGCDFYAFSGHKCYGPTGVGVLYGRKELLEQMAPVYGGSDMVERVDLDRSVYQPPPLRFESGTPSIGPVIALKSALEFLEGMGWEEVLKREHTLLQVATEGLLKVPGLRLMGTAPDKSGIVTFSIEGVHPLDLATLLDLKGIAIRSGHLCSQPVLRAFGCETVARASFGLYNTVEEVERFTKEVKQIAENLSEKTKPSGGSLGKKRVEVSSDRGDE